MEVTLDSIRDIKLYQRASGYRFSVDSLLLSDFVSIKKVKSAADLGAGAGIVGILLARKYRDARFTLFEIQEGLASLAERNAVLNLLEDRIKVIHCDVRRISECSRHSHSFDLVVSNPPFRRLKSGRVSLEEESAIARHEVKLKLPDLMSAASYLLRERGRFCLIYHPWRLSELMEMLRDEGLEPKRMRFVHSNIHAEAKMVLIEAIKGGKGGIKVERPLFIYKSNSVYTDEMTAIYNPV